MDYLTIREDVNVHGTVNENINIYDHRPTDNSLGLGGWLGIGLGVVALASLFIKDKPKPEPKYIPQPVPTTPSKTDQEFNLVLECLRDIEDDVNKFGSTDSALEAIETVIDYVSKRVHSFGEFGEFVITYRIKKMLKNGWSINF